MEKEAYILELEKAKAEWENWTERQIEFWNECKKLEHINPLDLLI